MMIMKVTMVIVMEIHKMSVIMKDGEVEISSINMKNKNTPRYPSSFCPKLTYGNRKGFISGALVSRIQKTFGDREPSIGQQSMYA